MAKHSHANPWWDNLTGRRRWSLDRYLRQLRDLFETAQKDDLLWWHRAGLCVLNLSPPDDQRYKQRFMEWLADQLDPGRDPARKSIVTFLYQLRELTRKLDQTEVDALAARIKGGELSIQHVANLLTVDEKLNTKTRARFLRECLKHGWSSNELLRQIRANKQGIASRGGRRAQVRPAASPAAAAQDIVVLANRWKAREPYFADQGPLAAIPSCKSRAGMSQAQRERKQRQLIQQALPEMEKALKQLQEVLQLARTGKSTLQRTIAQTKEKLARLGGDQSG